MSKLLKMLSLLTVLLIISSAQDTTDTTKRQEIKLEAVPVDSLKDLKEINAKADSIMVDLRLIKEKLGIRKDTLR